MKTILMVYLILFKGYSVMRVCEDCEEWDKKDGWVACDSPMEFNYGHNGVGASGDTPQEAVYQCFKNRRPISKFEPSKTNLKEFDEYIM